MRKIITNLYLTIRINLVIKTNSRIIKRSTIRIIKIEKTILKSTSLLKRSLSIIDIRSLSTLIINSINILEIIERRRSL